MKIFKIVLKVSLVVLLVLSSLLNVFMFRSSYGTLLLKYDEQKFYSMVGAQSINFQTTHFLDKANEGLQIEVESNVGGEITKTSYKFHFDKGSNLTAKTLETSSGGNEKTTYYLANVLYKDELDTKVKYQTTESLVISTSVTEIYTLLTLLLTDISTRDAKTKIDFSFAPFYLLGVKYETEQGSTFHFDLEGRVRKIVAKSGENTTTYILKYKNNAISLPNLQEFE